ncbi:MAG: chemotaxis protein CheX [Phycisphaerales bacterium]|nr:chemotaxis protein CheX [Phycisphaerales bacterium]
MDAKFIAPFMSSTQNVFSTMLQLPVEIGEPHVKDTQKPSFDVSGIIGVSGDMVGSIVLSFPRQTAERVVALFTGAEFEYGGEDFADAVGELVNMISGGAKAGLAGINASISCPSVVVGEGHSVSLRSDAPCIAIPFNTDCGEFVLEVALAECSESAAAA